MNRKIVFSINEFYHLYNRGIEKRIIFLDKTDYERFLLLLKVANNTKSFNLRDLKEQNSLGLTSEDMDNTLVDIGSYCLMPNHFHILLKEKVEGGISKFMSKLTTGYSMYFNKRYERKGSLFQGVFQAQHANSDNYLKYLFSYIHLNPIKLIQFDWKENGIDNIDGAKKYLDDYIYSSFPDYVGVKRKENNILNMKVFPEYFESVEDFKNNIFDWLEFNPELLKIEV
ncbi:MAG: transposase [Candidatus Pacebacteria bacterium]|nr:transposase [Candidatus Paceibacterota bacterium]